MCLDILAEDDKTCSYHDVINHLNLDKNNSTLTLTRPVTRFNYPTIVHIQLILYTILDVVSLTEHTLHNNAASLPPDVVCLPPERV